MAEARADQEKGRAREHTRRIRDWLRAAGRWLPGWHKESAANGQSARVIDGTGQLVEMEYYEPSGDSCGDVALYNVRIETPDGELILRHITHRLSDDAYDIHVTEPDGRVRVILHHSNVSGGEPFTIHEEWMGD